MLMYSSCSATQPTMSPSTTATDATTTQALTQQLTHLAQQAATTPTGELALLGWLTDETRDLEPATLNTTYEAADAALLAAGAHRAREMLHSCVHFCCEAHEVGESTHYLGVLPLLLEHSEPLWTREVTAAQREGLVALLKKHGLMSATSSVRVLPRLLPVEAVQHWGPGTVSGLLKALTEDAPDRAMRAVEDFVVEATPGAAHPTPTTPRTQLTHAALVMAITNDSDPFPEPDELRAALAASKSVANIIAVAQMSHSLLDPAQPGLAALLGLSNCVAIDRPSLWYGGVLRLGTHKRLVQTRQALAQLAEQHADGNLTALAAQILPPASVSESALMFGVHLADTFQRVARVQWPVLPNETHRGALHGLGACLSEAGLLGDKDTPPLQRGAQRSQNTPLH